MSGEHFIRFPPGRGHVFVPDRPRRDTLAGLALYAGCRRHALLTQRATWLAVSGIGGRALPGARLTWRPPMPEDQWQHLVATWRRELGQFSGFALIVRPQHSRSGFALLLLESGTPVAFVKVRDDPGPLHREHQALDLLSARPRGVQVPVPLASGAGGNWTWLAMSPMTDRPHHPEPNAPVEELVTELQDRLAVLPRLIDTPAHWRPMHGDLTPWNLRCADGRRWLLDWEEVGYGPPGADALYYQLTAASVNVPALPLTTVSDEAVAFWQLTLDRRRESTSDLALSAFLLNRIGQYLP